MKITPHFSLDELTKSQTALRLGIDNAPGAGEVTNLKLLSESILEPIRVFFQIPFSPSSAFRAKTLNRAIGSSDASQHIVGQAVDFEIPTIPNPTLALWIKDNLVFDQLILEYFDHELGPNSGWVHASFKSSSNRGDILTINSKGTFPGLYF